MLPPKLNEGSRVIIEITPALAFLPNRVDCGPRSTSTRWTSGRSPIWAAVRLR